MFRYFQLVALLFFFLEGKAQEQDTTLFMAKLDEILRLPVQDVLNVSTASKVQQDIRKAPGVITVMDREEIEAFGGNSLFELLDRATGIFATGTYSNPQNMISIRGKLPVQNNNQVLMLLNGRPIRDPYWGGFDFPVLLAFPLEMIERIEIIRGPGSVLYGTNAFSGIVNVITKENIKNTSINMGGGSFGNHFISMAQGTSKGKLHVNSAFRYFRERGWRLNAIGEAMDTIGLRMGETNLGMNINARYGNLNLNTFWGYSGQDIIGHAPTTQLPVDVRNRENEGIRGFADLGYSHGFTDGWEAALNLNFNLLSQRTWVPPGQLDGYTTSWLLEQTNYITISDKLEMVIGGTYYFIRGRAEIGDDPLLGAPSFKDDLYNAYIQSTWSPLTWLDFVGGIQLNKVNGLPLDIVPRLGLIGTLGEHFNAKLLYGRAYRAGFPAEKRFQAPPQAVGNPNLAPESINTFDIQLMYERKAWELGLTYFNSSTSDMITRLTVEQEDATFLQYKNIGGQEIQGIELEGGCALENGWEMNLGATKIFETEMVTGIKTPDLMLKTGIRYELEERFILGIHNSFFSGSDVRFQEGTLMVNPEPSSFNWTTFNLKLDMKGIMGIDMTPGLFMDLYIVNLLDEDVHYVEYVRGNINTIPGRSGRAFHIKMGITL